MLNRKMLFSFRKSAWLLSQIILILAFGCGPAPTPIIITLPTATARPDQPPPPTTTAVPTIDLSLPTATSFVPRAVIKIFTHVPLSGLQAEFGQDILHGAELAVEQKSGPLNELSYKVELVSYDDQGDRSLALANADAIVADPEILCGVGHYSSDITIAASNVYHLAGLGFVAPSATAPLLTDQNFLEANRVIGRADGQGRAAAQFAASQGYGSTYIVSQQADRYVRNAESFRNEAGNLGVRWLGSAITNITNENMNRTVNQVINANPDVLYISSSADQALPLLTELRAAGYQGTFLGTDELNDPSLISLAGSSLVQDGALYYTIMSPPARYHPQAAEFIQDFNRRYDSAPLEYAARAYDAAGMCLRAIEVASTAKNGELPTRPEVARALRRINNYKGITGTYDFNREGDPDPVQYYIYQVTSVDATNWDQNPIVASYEMTPP